jgi:hypothetical protein
MAAIVMESDSHHQLLLNQKPQFSNPKPRRTTYQSSDDGNPFLGDETISGSICDKRHLDWLRAEIQDGVDVGRIISPSVNLDQQCEKLLVDYFGVQWDDVITENCSPSVNYFYEGLRSLGERPILYYPSSPPGSETTPCIRRDPVQLPYHSPSSPVTPTKSYSTGKLNSTKTTPLCHFIGHPNGDDKAPIVQQSSSPSLPRPPQFHEPENTPSPFRHKSEIKVSNTSATTSDATYLPSTPAMPPITSSQSYYDKPEPDVVAAVRGFLALVRKFLLDNILCQGIQISVR